MEETKKAIYMQSLKSRQAMTVCHQNNREVTTNALMLLNIRALAGDSQSCQQRVGGFSVGGKGSSKEKLSQTGSQQRLSETRDTQRKPDIGMLVKDRGGTGKIETQRNVSVPYGVGGAGPGNQKVLSQELGMNAKRDNVCEYQATCRKSSGP